MRERDDYDDQMDQLVLKMSSELDGIPEWDCASAAAMLLAFALRDWSDREQALLKLIDFIHHVWEARH
jgi:hypothetical protein